MPMLIVVETTILSPFQRAFRSGCFSSARAVSLTMMSVMAIDGASPAPATALNCCRRLTRFVASTVVESVTAAVVCALWTIRSAIVRRMGVTAISRDAERWNGLPLQAGRMSGRGSLLEPRRGCRARRSGRYCHFLSVRAHRPRARGRCAGRAARCEASSAGGRGSVRAGSGVVEGWVAAPSQASPARTEPRPPGMP